MCVSSFRYLQTHGEDRMFTVCIYFDTLKIKITQKIDDFVLKKYKYSYKYKWQFTKHVLEIRMES